jgi:hypothetical protein
MSAMTVRELIIDLSTLNPNLEIWLQDETANDGFSPLDHLDEVIDGDPAPGEPKLCLGLFHRPAGPEPAWPGDR